MKMQIILSAMFVALGTYMLSWTFVPDRTLNHVAVFSLGVFVLILGIDIRRALPPSPPASEE